MHRLEVYGKLWQEACHRAHTARTLSLPKSKPLHAIAIDTDNPASHTVFLQGSHCSMGTVSSWARAQVTPRSAKSISSSYCNTWKLGKIQVQDRGVGMESGVTCVFIQHKLHLHSIIEHPKVLQIRLTHIVVREGRRGLLGSNSLASYQDYNFAHHESQACQCNHPLPHCSSNLEIR